jgi:hypothetical protein
MDDIILRAAWFSKIQGFKDSIIQSFKDSKIQGRAAVITVGAMCKTMPHEVYFAGMKSRTPSDTGG